MSAPVDGIALLRAVRDSLSTPAGRAVAREIVGALRLADEEAIAADPIAASVDEAFSRARRKDRVRAGARRGAR